jgi:hypothetical protein
MNSVPLATAGRRMGGDDWDNVHLSNFAALIINPVEMFGLPSIYSVVFVSSIIFVFFQPMYHLRDFLSSESECTSTSSFALDGARVGQASFQD